MKAAFKIGQRVQLVSFHGMQAPPSVRPEQEDYWRLIGTRGTVIEVGLGPHPFYKERGEQVLVQFDVDPLDLGLHCHNAHPRSPRIFVSDLELL